MLDLSKVLVDFFSYNFEILRTMLNRDNGHTLAFSMKFSTISGYSIYTLAILEVWHGHVEILCKQFKVFAVLHDTAHIQFNFLELPPFLSDFFFIQ